MSLVFSINSSFDFWFFFGHASIRVTIGFVSITLLYDSIETICGRIILQKILSGEIATSSMNESFLFDEDELHG